MIRVLVLAPVLGRPERVRPLAESLAESISGPVVGADLLFLGNRSDAEEAAAIATVVLTPPSNVGVLAEFFDEPGPGDYARKINAGWRAKDHDFVLLGADDLRFQPGWLESALVVQLQTGACVVGTNDAGNPATGPSGIHSTHPLVSRAYTCGTIDDPDPGKLLHEGYDHNFCNPPEAPIWMGDLGFRPLGDVRVGDTVIGWKYLEGSGRAPRRGLSRATVTNVARRSSPLVYVRMESGRTISCTPDHRWLNSHWHPGTLGDGSRGGGEWIVPAAGRSLVHVIDEPSPINASQWRAAGYLAGIYDGEGSGIYAATQSADRTEVLDSIRDALAELGVRYSEKLRKSGIVDFILTGGRQSYLDYLLRVQPSRSAALAAHIVGSRRRGVGVTGHDEEGGRRFGKRDRIVAVEPMYGDAHEVISLTTTTGNYVAWGYASRNCDNEFVGTAKHRGVYAHAAESVIEHLHPIWGKSKTDATYERGQSGWKTDQALHQARRHLWAGSEADGDEA